MSQHLSNLTTEELLKKQSTLKTEKIIDAFIVGFTVGIFAYAVYTSGFGIFTFFPLAIGYLIVKGSAAKKIIEQELLAELEKRKAA